jgi:hypothetical protein
MSDPYTQKAEAVGHYVQAQQDLSPRNHLKGRLGWADGATRHTLPPNHLKVQGNTMGIPDSPLATPPDSTGEVSRNPFVPARCGETRGSGSGPGRRAGPGQDAGVQAARPAPPRGLEGTWAQCRHGRYRQPLPVSAASHTHHGHLPVHWVLPAGPTVTGDQGRSQLCRLNTPFTHHEEKAVTRKVRIVTYFRQPCGATPSCFLRLWLTVSTPRFLSNRWGLSRGWAPVFSPGWNVFCQVRLPLNSKCPVAGVAQVVKQRKLIILHPHPPDSWSPWEKKDGWINKVNT